MPSPGLSGAQWVRQALFITLSVILVGGVLYTARFGIFDDTLLRVGGLAIGMLLVLCRPHGDRRRLVHALVDLVLGAVFMAAMVHYAMSAEILQTGLFFPDSTDLMLAIGALLVLLELTRRVVGLPLVVVCLLGAGYALFGDQLGGLLNHAGVDLNGLITTIWFSFDGVFGRPLAVVVSTIIIYIIFGSLLESLGAGEVLLKFALRSFGRVRGGAAHAAILASCLFGSISGSAVANVVGTGVVTIPMIKRTGFSGRFAGAVEAAASSGGQIMPPVMGAVAFIMADLTSIPYLHVCLAALLPALLYYGGLFAAVAIEAKNADIAPPDPKALPKVTRHDYLMLLVFVVPLAMIVIQLMRGVSPALAGFWALVTALVAGLILNPEARSLARLRDAITSAAMASATILIAVAAIGIIIAIMNLTGLGLQFASAALAISGGSLLLSLIVMAAACLVLGMGMPTVPAYLVIILVMGRAVEAMGVPTIAAHMFVVYFAVMSSITPPVALAAFAAASVANVGPMGVAATAVRLALLGFLVPFGFAYSPSLLLIVDNFSMIELLWVLARLCFAGWLLAVFGGRGRLWALGGIVGGALLVLPFVSLQLTTIALAVAAEIAFRMRNSAKSPVAVLTKEPTR